jgi:hypothetical protein
VVEEEDVFSLPMDFIVKLHAPYTQVRHVILEGNYFFRPPADFLAGITESDQAVRLSYYVIG